jgi:hypothetical protein
MAINRQYLTWGILVIWFLIISALLTWWRFQDYGHFDQHGLWLDSAPATVNQSSDTSGGIIYHIRAGCSCDILADRHRELFDELANYRQVTVSPNDIEAMGISVPSTPTLLVVNDSNVVYAGPYASGPSCSVDNSVVATIFNEQSGNMTTPWYNGSVKACRCVDTR